MFYGPDAPYVVYGSQSTISCLGQWIQDARALVPDDHLGPLELDAAPFANATELDRPPPRRQVEKNWFLFWDSDGRAHVHSDLLPTRAFAPLGADGSVGDNLGPQSAARDDVCLDRYVPKPQELESVHQATNSLAVTLCRRADPDCIPADDNTFILTVFQHKTYHDYHALYYSYPMLLQSKAPYSIHGIAEKPIWIHGRGPLTNKSKANQYYGRPEDEIPRNHTEMHYVTSISWKMHGQRSHGFIDDPLFVSFGIEDTAAGAIDVAAGDLLQDLALCGD
jgi:hypothetical protein